MLAVVSLGWQNCDDDTKVARHCSWWPTMPLPSTSMARSPVVPRAGRPIGFQVVPPSTLQENWMSASGTVSQPGDGYCAVKRKRIFEIMMSLAVSPLGMSVDLTWLVETTWPPLMRSMRKTTSL